MNGQSKGEAEQQIRLIQLTFAARFRLASWQAIANKRIMSERLISHD